MIKYLLSAIILVLLDSIYLNIIKTYYNNLIKSVQGENIQISYLPVAITYIFLIYALNYFIIRRNRSFQDAAILGVIIYGVYNFTNLSLLKNWSIIISIIDTMWGGVLFGLTTYIVELI